MARLFEERDARRTIAGGSPHPLPEFWVQYIFDISTSAQWAGPAVGIVRVERELARRAPEHLGEAVTYGVYVKSENRFHRLSHRTADSIIAGRLALQFDKVTPVRAAPRTGLATSARRRVRALVMKSSRVYQLIQRLRGVSFTLAEIDAIRAQEAMAPWTADGSPAPVVRLSEVSEGVIALGPDTVVISGGLDWEKKDLRALHRVKKTAGFRYVPIVYDLIPLRFPHFVVPAYVDLLADYFGELFWLADACLCISESTRNDMTAFCLRQGIPTPPSATFPLGHDLHRTEADEVAEIPHVLDGMRYAIMVSTIEPRKNHRALYMAWDHCIRQDLIDPQTCRLVFVGHEGWNVTELMHEIGANPHTKDSIIVTGPVDDADLQALYRGARFGVFPSFYEGYGLPLAELLGHNKPCISSPAGALPEIGRDLVVYRDPLDIVGWAGAMADFFNDDVMLEQQRDRILAEHRSMDWDMAALRFFSQLDVLTAAL